MNKIKVGIGVMLINKGRILLFRRKNKLGRNLWAWPGGHLNYGETIHECAKREVREETGIHLEDKDLSYLCTSNIIEYGQHYIDIELVANIEETKIKPNGEFSSYGWFIPKEVEKKELFKACELGIIANKTQNPVCDFRRDKDDIKKNSQ